MSMTSTWLLLSINIFRLTFDSSRRRSADGECTHSLTSCKESAGFSLEHQHGQWFLGVLRSGVGLVDEFAPLAKVVWPMFAGVVVCVRFIPVVVLLMSNLVTSPGLAETVCVVCFCVALGDGLIPLCKVSAELGFASEMWSYMEFEDDLISLCQMVGGPGLATVWEGSVEWVNQLWKLTISSVWLLV